MDLLPGFVLIMRGVDSIPTLYHATRPAGDPCIRRRSHPYSAEIQALADLDVVTRALPFLPRAPRRTSYGVADRRGLHENENGWCAGSGDNQ